MAQLASSHNHKPNRLPAQSNNDAPSVNELARQFTAELIRWRGNMAPAAIVDEAFALAEAFKSKSEQQGNST